jgi:hypothetical protein
MNIPPMSQGAMPRREKAASKYLFPAHSMVADPWSQGTTGSSTKLMWSGSWKTRWVAFA